MSKKFRERSQSWQKVIVARPGDAKLLPSLLERLRLGDHNFKTSLGTLSRVQIKCKKKGRD